ncbi:NAD-dependent dehydratase [Paraburkholderia sp. D15]|uniref:NAD-dependent dehydratase n=1 Tax=Paraburkholderia sp. D15 TaxID=2880218 RepID=UPI00247925BF|nr:NAD-dependent dehydratase [Paraburkholderia sp. D15]WGS54251.1 NAD-dependent dehydratase [Paraburkholderia sp. D15]
MKLLLLGATGLVGSRTLALALSGNVFSEVIAPTRRPLPPRDGLVNPVASGLETLVTASMSYEPDAVICALGTTQAKAGSKEAFRQVDYELPLIFAGAAHSAGVNTFAIVTAMGASAESMSFYYRTKGEVEKGIREIGFQSLSICRPSLIGGERNEARTMEGAALTLFRVLAPVLPKKLRINSADAIAAALIDAVIAAKPGCRYIHSQEMA